MALMQFGDKHIRFLNAATPLLHFLPYKPLVTQECSTTAYTL